MKINKIKTSRGFDRFEFQDDYGLDCSLQKSSSAEEDCIWLGLNNAHPQIMCSEAKRLGLEVKTNDYFMGEPTGWQPYEIPKEVLLSTRMHLTRKQAKILGELLIKFAKRGELE